ncbi:MAG: hypothetical protein OXU36_10580 [Candidatus Poribacteria bacterium]|nr:hypothetical protein [Candidatus Poribacteria bacterium]
MAKAKQALTRDQLLAKPKIEVQKFTLPNGSIVCFKVLSFEEIRDILSQWMEPDVDRIDLVGQLVGVSVCDEEGKRLLEKGEYKALFSAFDAANYGALAEAVQRGYKLIQTNEEVSGNLN